MGGRSAGFWGAAPARRRVGGALPPTQGALLALLGTRDLNGHEVSLL